MDLKKFAVGITAALLITQPVMAQNADDDDTVTLAPIQSGPDSFAGLGGAEGGVAVGGAIAFIALLAILSDDSSSTTTTPTAAVAE